MTRPTDPSRSWLKSLRNDIAHGGEHERPTFLLYSDELEDVLENLLQSIGNAILNDPRKHNFALDGGTAINLSELMQ